MIRRLAAILAFALLAFGADRYEAGLYEWRATLQQDLQADYGWLSLSGLYWLKPGLVRFGSAAGNEIQLRGAAYPPQAGAFRFDGSKVMLEAAAGVAISVNGKPARNTALKSDAAGQPDIVQNGDTRMTVIQRGNRTGIRVRDRNNPARRDFKGLKWYPVNRRFRVQARFVPFPAPKQQHVMDAAGGVQTFKIPGYVEFSLDGVSLRLEPDQSPGGFSFVFRDRTAGKETYPAGRFLDTPLPKNGRVTLDFNRAYNPPCAYTPYATCPLPPRQNHLPVAIRAGELNDGHH